MEKPCKESCIEPCLCVSVCVCVRACACVVIAARSHVEPSGSTVTLSVAWGGADLPSLRLSCLVTPRQAPTPPVRCFMMFVGLNSKRYKEQPSLPLFCKHGAKIRSNRFTKLFQHEVSNYITM